MTNPTYQDVQIENQRLKAALKRFADHAVARGAVYAAIVARQTYGKIS